MKYNFIKLTMKNTQRFLKTGSVVEIFNLESGVYRLIGATGLVCSIFLFLVICGGCRMFNGGKTLVLNEAGFIKDDLDHDGAPALFKELGGEEVFLDLAQYLYRWYLDEDDFRNFDPEFRGKLWIRKVSRVLDPEDRSSFIEIFLPAIRLMVNLKKTDYVINELNLEVKSDGYKIASVGRVEDDVMLRSEDYASLDMDLDALYNYLFDNRLKADYPDEEMLDYLRKSVKEQCEDYGKGMKGEQLIWLAPISPVANEIWVYWENRKMLFNFRADVDMHKREIWEHDSIQVIPYDIVNQTIVTYEESPCDDDFITRDQVGRVLFNCMALGRKVSIEQSK